MTKQSECAPSESLVICPVWSESSLFAWIKPGSLATYWVHSEDSEQTGWIPRLMWVFAGHTLILLVLPCHGSFYYTSSLCRRRAAIFDCGFLWRCLLFCHTVFQEWWCFFVYKALIMLYLVHGWKSNMFETKPLQFVHNKTYLFFQQTKTNLSLTSIIFAHFTTFIILSQHGTC